MQEKAHDPAPEWKWENIRLYFFDKGVCAAFKQKEDASSSCFYYMHTKQMF